MIRMVRVSKTFPNGLCALADIDLEIPSGEFVYIAGPNGSGKTTLLRLIYGMEKPTSGEVTVDGIDLGKGFGNICRLRRKMGIVSPDVKLLQDRTARGNLAFALEVAGCSGKEAQRRITETLDRFDLLDKQDAPITALSAGEQQRVAIARAFANDPPLVVADEPTESLDPDTMAEVMEIFKAYHVKGTCIVFATRQADLIRRYPYPVISLVAGRRVNGEPSAEV